jgi:hypothetical protein
MIYIQNIYRCVYFQLYDPTCLTVLQHVCHRVEAVGGINSRCFGAHRARSDRRTKPLRRVGPQHGHAAKLLDPQRQQTAAAQIYFVAIARPRPDL